MASKDLDKLMGKLKKKEVVEEKPKEDDIKTDVLEDDDLDDTDEDTVEEDVKHDPKHDIVENEVAVLQNDGVYRRELLITLKELVKVQTIQADTFLEIKKKLSDE